MKAIAWKWGFRVWIGKRTIGLLGPRDKPLFSEREGYRKPFLRIGPWRVFFDTSNTRMMCAED